MLQARYTFVEICNYRNNHPENYSERSLFLIKKSRDQQPSVTINLPSIPIRITTSTQFCWIFRKDIWIFQRNIISLKISNNIKSIKNLTEKSLYYIQHYVRHFIQFLRIVFHYLKKFVFHQDFLMVVSVVSNVAVVIGAIGSHKDVCVIFFREIS